jgi:hypothetical protein
VEGGGGVSVAGDAELGEGEVGVSGPTLLWVLLGERHWRQFRTFEAQFLKAARDLAAREEEPWIADLTVSERTFERWAFGKIRRSPHPDASRVLEHMFGYPVQELLRCSGAGEAVSAAPAGSEVSSGAGPQASEDVTRALRAVLAGVGGDVVDVDDVERRELLRLLAGLGVAAPLVAGADRVRRNLDGALNAPTTGADVTEWERVAAQYSAGSGTVPPAVVLPELLTDLDEAQTRLRDSPEALRVPMARVCGQLSALAAANFFNAGDEGNARRYWRTALRVIGYADDRPAQASLYGYRAVFALDDGSSPETALSFADDAIGIAGGTPGAGAARGYVARATALALLGEHRESTRTLGDLADTFAGLPEATAGARGMWVYSEQELHFTHSRVYSYAGRSADATRSWEAGRALVPRGLPLAAAAFELGRATSLILGADPSEGARHVVRTVNELPPGYRQSATIRWKAARALDAVPARAASVPAVAEARELLALPPGGNKTL